MNRAEHAQAIPRMTYSVAETAVVLGVSVYNVRSLVRRGRLAALGRGKIALPSLAAYIAGAGGGDRGEVLSILAGWMGRIGSESPARQEAPPSPGPPPPADRARRQRSVPSFPVGDVADSSELLRVYDRARGR